MLRRLMPLLAVLLALGSVAPARALTTISEDTTLPDHPIHGDTISDDVEVDDNVVLTINGGGSITGNVQLNDGVVVIINTGGSITGNIDDFPGGFATGASVKIAGGTISGWVAGHGVTIEMTAGSVGGHIAGSGADVTLTGGAAAGASLCSGGELTIDGALIEGEAYVCDGSELTITAGRITGGIRVFGNYVGMPESRISGGTIFGGVRVESGSIHISGGRLDGTLSAEGTGQIHVYGCNLLIQNNRLTGFLQTGEPLSVAISTSGSGQIALHEEAIAPVISNASVTPSQLGPADHRMVPVTVNYDLSCGATAVLSVSSNEPVNTPGDGNTSPDWQVVDDHHVLLRAERSGNGTGRIYTITITATNAAGETSQRQVAVTVPVSRR